MEPTKEVMLNIITWKLLEMCKDAVAQLFSMEILSEEEYDKMEAYFSAFQTREQYLKMREELRQITGV